MVGESRDQVKIFDFKLLIGFDFDIVHKVVFQIQGPIAILYLLFYFQKIRFVFTKYFRVCVQPPVNLKINISFTF